MKSFKRVVLLLLICMAALIIAITACGRNSTTPPGTPGTLKAFVLNSNPAGFHVTKAFTTARASASGMFVVNAQTTTPGAGDFPGFCNALAPNAADHRASVLFGIGRWTSGNCDDAATPDSSIGVNFQQVGQIGNLTVDAVGLGGAADSGQIEVKLIHTDGTETIVPLTCSLGVNNNPTGRVHCEDKQAAHFTSVAATDEMSARIFYNSADTFHAIRVHIAYASPTF